MATDDEIVGMAHLVLAVDAGKSPMSELDQALTLRDISDGAALWLAVKLIEGKPYRIQTDNPATVSRARAIAALVGGTVASVEENAGMTSITFAPAHRQ